MHKWKIENSEYDEPQTISHGISEFKVHAFKGTPEDTHTANKAAVE